MPLDQRGERVRLRGRIGSVGGDGQRGGRGERSVVYVRFLYGRLLGGWFRLFGLRCFLCGSECGERIQKFENSEFFHKNSFPCEKNKTKRVSFNVFDCKKPRFSI